MIKDTVGTIAGNTIGKIPVGAGKKLTDVYRGFTQWVGNTMDKIRMKAGLPTKNVTPTTAMEDATKNASIKSVIWLINSNEPT